MMILKHVKKNASIKLMIHEAATGWDEPRDKSEIHASDLFKDFEFCPREWAFFDLGLVKPKKSFLGAAQQITFDIGHDVEKRIRNDWLRKHVVGYWRCGVCGSMYPKWGKLPKVSCSVCSYGHLWTYDEVIVKNEDSGVIGSIDAFVDTGEMKLRLLELKTMDKDMHRKLIAPLAEHRYRTALYLWLVENSNLPEKERVNVTQAFILYMSKSYGFKDTSMKEAGQADMPFSPFKEFTVERCDDILKTPLAKAKVLTTWRKMRVSGGSNGLPCGICSNGLTKRGQSCPAISHCFSGNYLSTLTWLEDGKPRHHGKTVVE